MIKGKMMKKKLPVGIPDFETIRTDGYVYVDKTQLIHQMVTMGKFYFLSRPRRFGKSVLTTTLQALFEGKRELFDGLWIAEHGEWEWDTYPVLLLDFTTISNQTSETLELALDDYLERIARGNDIQLKGRVLMSKFTELLVALSNKHGKAVAILIDEYDKPIIDHLGKGREGLEIAKANRAVLKGFFGVLKSISIARSLKFVFLTGISRFSKVSIFSELNNLEDISMRGEYAGLLGYTQEELEQYFPKETRQFAEECGWSRKNLIAKLAEQYNGYRFSQKALSVYNPFSILQALNNKEFGHYWFESGTPTFLVNLLLQEKYSLAEIEGKQVSQALFSSFDLEKLQPEALLFQTGYVTISDVRRRLYTLDYPNQEVKSAFSESLLFSFAAGAADNISSQVFQLAAYLEEEDFDAFFETVSAVFASIPYDIQTKRDESYFHTLFYLMITASGGADARSSVLTSRGKIDLAVILPDKVYIMEFKCNQSAETAIRQIHDKGYAEPYRQSGKKIILFGINFSEEEKNLAEWKIEALR